MNRALQEVFVCEALDAASETAETLQESLQKGKKEGSGGCDQFFQTSDVNFTPPVSASLSTMARNPTTRIARC